MSSVRIGSFLCICLIAIGLSAPARAEDILTTKHNLSLSGPGVLKATEESRVCIFCHTPHHATEGETLLWSRELSSASYTPYTSSTLDAQPGQPSGGSRLCLACHDGTIALGMLGRGHRISSLGPIPEGETNLGTDISDDHPISFDYTSELAQGGDIVDPAELPGTIRLENGRLECTACHNPHKDPYGKFLVADNTDSALCETCHLIKGWDSSAHLPPNTACESCHTSHTAGQHRRLLRESTEEGTCTATCHNGSGTGVNVNTVFQSFYRHPVQTATGVHDAVEDPLTAEYHVECADCHNSHRLQTAEGNPPGISGEQTGVSGVDAAGKIITEATNQYEVCYKCHADHSFVLQTAVPRQFQEVNQRLRFDPLNPSFHPVASPGRNSSVPNLRPEYNESSMIYCTDCHGSDGSIAAGGTGANGPHGSSIPHILIAEYKQDSSYFDYSEQNYQLCWRCHDPILLFGQDTHFRTDTLNLHTFHVQQQGQACSFCHDPHGVPSSHGATTSSSAHLINFDIRLFTTPPLYDAELRSCTVSCHPTNPQTY